MVETDVKCRNVMDSAKKVHILPADENKTGLPKTSF